MKITRRHLDAAVAEGILTPAQSAALLDFVGSRSDTSPAFNFTNLLYYFGGLIAIGAMTVFMNLGWERFGGWGIFTFAAAYAAIGVALSEFFRRRGHPVPAGVCATFAVALVPLALYGLQIANGWWPDDSTYRDYHRYIRWHWIYLELGTLAAGVIMLWRFRYPFMVMPVAVTLWYMSMDVAAMLMADTWDWEFRAFVSMWFGLATTLLAVWVDLRSRNSADFAFWLYIFGVMTFWCGLSMQDSDSEFAKFVYFCVNIGLVLIGAVLVRRVFVVFGAFGVAGYLGHLANEVFEDSWLFPVALAAIGLLIVYLGLVWSRHEAAVTAQLRSCLPLPLRELIEARA
ncbi:MAG TPA: DUF2157 domain-containing protein [Woeseiaceae bacterium]|nr:DUF2157 domain-containing protein [Woeseiaceae bacterium]